MSSPNVRSAMRALATSGTWPGTLPYRETFNQYVDPATIESAWSTVSYGKPDTQRIALGRHEYLERGEITVHAFAPRGASFAEIEGAADALRPVILGHVWPSSIGILAVGAMDVISPGGAGLHVHAQLDVEYTYQHGGGL